jgi:hypothetical protein
MEAIARGFGIPVERVHLAASRSLARYKDDGTPLATNLRELPIDVLLTEIRRRVVGGPSDDVEPPTDLARIKGHVKQLSVEQANQGQKKRG